LQKYAYQEARYSTLARSNPEVARDLLLLAQADVDRRWRVYSNLAATSETPNIVQSELVASVRETSPEGETK